MDEFRELPWKEWGPAIIAGIAVIVTGTITAIYKLIEVRMAKGVEVVEHSRTMDINQNEDLTNRLRILMEGYENRIRELSAELIATKDELREANKRHGRDTARHT